MLIVGLGNPEKKYENTYHNVGFAVIDKLAEILNITLKEEACRAKYSTMYKNGEKVIIAKPLTYMNLSGEAVVALSSRYNIPVSDIIVVYDDIDLPVGDIRIRKSGSAGTHNGMRNICGLLGGNNFPRVRIGIGKPEPPMQLVDYVLSHIKGDNKDKLDKSFEKAARLIADFICHKDLEKMMRDSK